MYFSNFISFLSQLGTFMVIFSLFYFLFKFIFNIILKYFIKNDYIMLKKIYISDCLSILSSLIFIFKFITIYPCK
ncbi:hypothetical protein ADT22_13000 [Clostridium botulinum]|nr:hypothetical protein ACP51_06310 [Clostridium botulinum]KOR57673.1 hypothetical protein ADT22_13000 [Clostridium botulinum]